MKRPALAVALSLLLGTVLGVTCDPGFQHLASHYYREHFERTHLRFRQIDACRFQVLDELPAGPGEVWLWHGGTSRGYYKRGFPGDLVRYDASSRVLEDLDCNPDAGLEPPYDITFETFSYSGHALPIENGPYSPFVY